MVEIIPAILAKNSEEFKTMVQKVEPFAELMHVDVGDGIFVPEKFGGIGIVQESGIKPLMQVHLMVHNPAQVAEEWLNLPNVRNIIFHIEAADKPDEIVDTVKQAGRIIGVALNPETKIERIQDLLDKIDFVQFMTVHPGNYGGKFVESVLDKVRIFHVNNPAIPISVDGSIHTETAKRSIAVGAKMLVLGYHIFLENRDIGEVIKELKQIG